MAIIRCQHCGHEIEIDAGVLRGVEAAQAGRQRKVNQFASSHKFDIATAAPQMPPGLHISRETPVFMPTFEANIVVPRAKAITYGFFAGGAVTLIVTGPLVMGGSNIWYAIAAGLTFGGVTFFITAAWAWHKSSGFYDSLLTRFEEMTGVDINQDGQVGDGDSVNININSDQGQKLETWPVSKRALVWFAKAVISNNPADTFSESTARQAGMSRKQWLFIRDTFISHRWAYWRNPDNPKLGVELTGMGGRKILHGIARGEMPAGTEADDDLEMSPHQVERSTGRGNWD